MGVRAFAAHMIKMHVKIFDAGFKLRERVEFRLGFTPIEAGGPVGGEVLDVVVVCAWRRSSASRRSGLERRGRARGCD